MSTKTKSLFVLTFLSCIIVASCFIPPTPTPERNPTVRQMWRYHGQTNSDLIEALSRSGTITSKEVKQALLSVDRVNYVTSGCKEAAHDDTPLPIGHGQTISAPHMHAHALEELLPAIRDAKPDDGQVRILDVGSGSGYLTAAFGRLLGALGKDGKVFGIDCVPALVEFSRDNIKKGDSDLVSSGVASLNVGDGWKGLPEPGPFHAIHVGAGADKLPKELVMQLAVGGRMVCPIDSWMGDQVFYRIDRIRARNDGKFHDDDYKMTKLMGVRYVPLVHVQ